MRLSIFIKATASGEGDGVSGYCGIEERGDGARANAFKSLCRMEHLGVLWACLSHLVDTLRPGRAGATGESRRGRILVSHAFTLSIT